MLSPSFALPFAFTVDFDLDKGPVASDIYPPVDLPPKDLENMSVNT